MAVSPTVIFPLTLPALLEYTLGTQSSTAPTTLVVCASQEAFLQDLSWALQVERQGEGDVLEQLVAPTLHNLFTTRHVKVIFCASVQTLLAFLTAFEGNSANQNDGATGWAKERILLVNPLSLHAPTPSFSAQGLSRTFAAAVEMALRLNAMLVVAECENVPRAVDDHSDEEDATMDDGEETLHGPGREDPWEQHVPILNVSARRFGSGIADRAWAGRTVKASRIAGTWFRFHKLEALDEQDRPT